MKVAFIHRVLTDYRMPLYITLEKRGNIQFHVFSLLFSFRKSNLGFFQPKAEQIAHKFPISRIPSRNWQNWIYRKYGVALPILAILRHVVRYNPDLVVFEALSNLGTVLLFTPYVVLKRIPFIWWSLGTYPGRKRSTRAKIGDSIQRWYIKRAASVLSYSTYGRDFMVKLGSSLGKTFVLYNTLDETAILKRIDQIRYRVAAARKELCLTNKPVAIFSGTIHKEKKLDILIKAFQTVRKVLADKDPQLIIMGDGENLFEYKDLAKRLELTESVHFVGKQDNEMASIYYLLANIAVLPGLGGLAINHAFIHRIPIICGKADGCEIDLVRNQRTGILLEDTTLATLADAIIRLLSDSKLAAELGKNAFNLITKKITLNNMASTIEKGIAHAMMNKTIN